MCVCVCWLSAPHRLAAAAAAAAIAESLALRPLGAFFVSDVSACARLRVFELVAHGRPDDNKTEFKAVLTFDRPSGRTRPVCVHGDGKLRSRSSQTTRLAQT